MIKRTVEISRDPCHLSARDEQLLILRRHSSARDGLWRRIGTASELDLVPDPARRLPAHPPNLAGSIPFEDLGLLMVDERDTTYTHTALVKLAEHGGALVVCGRDHHPVGMYVPVPSNTVLLERLDAQLAASRPTLKRVWAALVAAKVRAQAAALPAFEAPAVDSAQARLLALSRRVRSGDPENIEAQAAAAYWPVLFSEALPAHVPRPFRRRAGDRAAPPPNNLLDYGYAVLRASLARALVAAGLLPALGVKHAGRSNFFCLADDLIEPLRPLIDLRVRWLAQNGELSLTQSAKAHLLGVLVEEVQTGGLRGPLMVALPRFIASYVRVLSGEDKPTHLMIPESLWGGVPGTRTPAPPSAPSPASGEPDDPQEDLTP